METSKGHTKSAEAGHDFLGTASMLRETISPFGIFELIGTLGRMPGDVVGAPVLGGGAHGESKSHSARPKGH